MDYWSISSMEYICIYTIKICDYIRPDFVSLCSRQFEELEKELNTEETQQNINEGEKELEKYEQEVEEVEKKVSSFVYCNNF